MYPLRLQYFLPPISKEPPLIRATKPSLFNSQVSTHTSILPIGLKLQHTSESLNAGFPILKAAEIIKELLILSILFP